MKRLAVIAILVAVAVPALATPRLERRPICRVMVDRDTRLSPGLGPSTGFSAAVTDDVTVTVLLPAGTTGEHLLTVQFITPRGHLYQTMHVPISDEPRTMSIPGYARPVQARVPVQTVVERFPYLSVPIVFPVGGTSISANSIYGDWQVVVFLNSAETPCSPPLTLEIRP